MDTKPMRSVAIVRWPEEAGSIEGLRASGTPRLLLVAPDAAAPAGTDCAEDWIRLPAPDSDVRVRTLALAARAGRHSTSPELKGDGRISFRNQWVAISNTEESILRPFVERYEEVVDTHSLARRLDMTDNAMRVQMVRLRHRIGPIGLVLRTVRGRGYVLEHE